MLRGIPHSLLLSNVRGEMQVLVPVIEPKRPTILTEPFSTFIVPFFTPLELLSERYFLYPVHVSLSFLLTKGINSAVYLVLLRFLHRDYEDVFRLADSIATDTVLNPEGLRQFKQFNNTSDDLHPDAHACRLKITLVTIDSSNPYSWDITVEFARYIVKLDNVSSNCRLSPEEELQLLESEAIVLSTTSPKYSPVLHNEYLMALCFNRKEQLNALMKNQSGNFVEVACRIPARPISGGWPLYQDNTVFGETYTTMTEITSISDGEKSWQQEVCTV